MASPEFTESFWKLVDRRSSDECWPWRGPIFKGYGRFKGKGAHRIAYRLLKGEIPDGLTLDHLCRNRACCNPAHLEPVTNRVNVLRGVGPSAENSRKTHCANGHPFNDENTMIRSDSRGRECRECHRLWTRAFMGVRPRCPRDACRGFDVRITGRDCLCLSCGHVWTRRERRSR